MLHIRFPFFVFSILTGCSLSYGQPFANIDSLKINQLQVIGSHNSYHLRANKPVLNFLKGLSGILPKEYDPHELDYEHEPLQVQLDSFLLRSFEIDIYPDPEGGQFYYRKKNNLLGKPKASGIAALKEPGFKVMHIPDIDYNTRYYTFKSMLTDLKKWSDEHPTHLPVFILIEGKEASIASTLKKLHFTKAIPFTPALCDDI
ncbi:MAG: Ca2+-dependent phosphoinositide-specific phospholipase C, partial [Chitinophagales bacterium]